MQRLAHPQACEEHGDFLRRSARVEWVLSFTSVLERGCSQEPRPSTTAVHTAVAVTRTRIAGILQVYSMNEPNVSTRHLPSDMPGSEIRGCLTGAHPTFM